MRRSYCLLFPFLLLLVFAASAQDSSAPPASPPQALAPAKPAPPAAPVGSDRQITLDVQVTDKSGAPVLGLRQEDFALLDDGQPQTLTAFQAVNARTPSTNNPPVEVILLVDNVNVGPQAVAYERNEVKQYLLRNGGELEQPLSLIFFNDTNTQLQNAPSQDGKALAALYDKYETGLRFINRSQGFYGAEDRLDLSLQALSSIASYAQPRPGRKLVVWISPGWPLLSGPNVQLSKRDQQGIFNSIVSLSAGLRLAGITLYAIDPLGLTDAGGSWISYYKEFLKGVPSPSRAQIGNLGLQVLAVQTGGEAFNSSNDLAGYIGKCVRDANSYYVLSFNAPPADKPNEYHSLVVKVDKPGVTARTRTGYYAQP
ncbi:MAG TPA: VWA domain-containing protein [Verrucomicrobiae bacterium]|nr:VWA domain-containing protein [Verrucomicrobiae bacterium]